MTQTVYRVTPMLKLGSMVVDNLPTVEVFHSSDQLGGGSGLDLTIKMDLSVVQRNLGEDYGDPVESVQSVDLHFSYQSQAWMLTTRATEEEL